jgi:hypothetical protein
MTAEIKIKHSQNSGEEKPIWHFTSSSYSLEKYFAGPNIKEKASKPQSKKKKSKK